MKVQDAELNEEQFCCLLLAERVHSGYEGTNIKFIKVSNGCVLEQSALSLFILTDFNWSLFSLLFAAPRIPPDKRIFTTTHTPNCVFQDVDER